MSAGKYRHRVVFQSRTQANDATGAPIDTWATFATVWTYPKTITGRERWANDRTAHEYSLSLAIRHRTDITEEMRAVYNGRTLEVSTLIDPDERRRELIVLCKELKNG